MKEKGRRGPSKGEQQLTPLKKERFIAEYANCANISKCCKLIEISRTTFYEWKEKDPGFEAALRVAEEVFNDKIEAEIDRRAIEGVEKGVYYRGERVDTELEYSDTLLIFRAKARMPEKYKERSETNIKSDAPFIFNMNLQPPAKEEDGL